LKTATNDDELLNVDKLGSCAAMLVYLTARTWTSGEASVKLAEEVSAAMQGGVQLVLAHEMPGHCQEARDGVEFSTFFASDQTPTTLLKQGIYNSVAVPLKGGAWRKTSMALLAQDIATKAGRAPSRFPACTSALVSRLRIFFGRARVEGEGGDARLLSGLTVDQPSQPPTARSLSASSIDGLPSRRSFRRARPEVGPTAEAGPTEGTEGATARIAPPPLSRVTSAEEVESSRMDADHPHERL